MMEIYIHPMTFGGRAREGIEYNKFKSDIHSKFECEESKCENEILLNIVLRIKEDRVRHDGNDLGNFLKPIIDALVNKRCFDEA